MALASNGSATRSGFLPAEHQGTPVNHTEPDPEKMIPNLRNKYADKASQRRQLDALQALNKNFGESFGADASKEKELKLDE